MASSQKKVIVRRFSGDSIAGYLPAFGFIDKDAVSLLDLSGRLTPISLKDVKYAAFVRDFDLSEVGNIERNLRRTFLARPRAEGLWVRATFRSGDVLEGLVATGLTLLDEMLAMQGLLVTPPDTRTNYQRIYIPRAAITQLDLLGVIAPPLKTKLRRVPEAEEQNELFGPSDPG